MTESNSTIPQCIVDADATEAFRALEPPATQEEVEDIEWYNQTYGLEGVKLAIGLFNSQRTNIPDPDYPMISMATHLRAPIYTDEELAQIGPYTDEMKEEDRQYQEFMDTVFAFWKAEGLMNPSQVEARIEQIRREQGDEAAEAYQNKVYAIPISEEELKRRRRLRSRVVAAGMQREWQAKSREERRAGIASVVWLLYEASKGKYDGEDEDY